MNLKGTHTFLRALEPEDIDFLYGLENNPEFWEVSNTLVPFSRFILSKYLENAHRDIFEAKQLRLAICTVSDSSVVGLIDLYDFDPQHGRAGVGIVIAQKESRGRGYASEALGLLKTYAFGQLQLHQLYAGIIQENEASRRLFEKAGFEQTGLKIDWVKRGHGFVNEFIYQCIRE